MSDGVLGAMTKERHSMFMEPADAAMRRVLRAALEASGILSDVETQRVVEGYREMWRASEAGNDGRAHHLRDTLPDNVPVSADALFRLLRAAGLDEEPTP